MRVARPVWLVLFGGLVSGCLESRSAPPFQGGIYGSPGYAPYPPGPAGYHGPQAAPPGYYGPQAAPPGYYGPQWAPAPGGQAPIYGAWPAAPGAGTAGSGAAAAVAYAQARMGLPYCWGGNGPACYDCSGLTHAAWAAAGKSIPRTSEAQVEGLPVVAMGQIQPGDILWRPGHVGIYAGNGWAIAATQTGDVIRYQKASGYQRAVRP